MKKLYLFVAYKKPEDYPLKPFHKKLFENFDEMKNHSSNHSVRYKHNRCYPEYISNYTKIEL